jgi:hypothetical protein
MAHSTSSAFSLECLLVRVQPSRPRRTARLFERENAKIAPGIDKLYAGTKPATMRRYGETDDKTEEVI